jgi:GTP-binding protein
MNDRLSLEYIGSAVDPREYPRSGVPEVAIVGRSNAGKSSLLNLIGGRRHLARVSKTPGRTQRIHFFADRRHGLVVVDLPGYGFAQVSKSEHARFTEAIERYLVEREPLRGLVLLLDVRREPEADERVLADLARRRGIGLVRVATKIDKLARGERAKRLRDLDAAGLGPWLPFSAASREGLAEIVAAVRDLASPPSRR